MRKTLLSIAIFISLSVSAQDWRPLNQNDTIQQYLSSDTLLMMNQSMLFTNYITPRKFVPIQTILVDSVYTDSSATIVIYHKGYSTTSFYQNSTVFEVAEGKLLGDTSFFYSDSTVFKSTNPFDFDLTFLNNFNVNDSWQLAISANTYLQAFVESKWFDSIPNFYTQDSLAIIRLRAFSKASNQPISSHPFDSVGLLISKNHGLLKAPDFTEPQLIIHNKLNWTQVSISADENSVLKKGDEFSFVTERYLSGPFNSYYTLFQNDVVITADTIIGGTKYLTKRVSSNSLLPPIGNPTVLVYTDTIQLNNYILPKYSGIVFNKHLTNPNLRLLDLRGNSDLNTLGVCVIGNLRFYCSSLHDSYFSRNDSIMHDPWTATSPPTSPVPFEDLHLIGLGAEHFERDQAWGESHSYAFNYIKINNQSWTSPSIITGIKALSSQSNISVYPNPTTGALSIKSDYNIERIMLRDLNGRIVLDQQFNPQIDISELDPGIYLMALISSNGVITKKIVKN